MLGTQYTLTNQSGSSVTINDHSDPTAVIALQQYPSFDLQIRNEEIPKEGQHGIYDFFSFYGKRVIVFSGVIVADTEAEVLALRDDLIDVTKLPSQPADGNDGTVTLTFTDPTGRALQVDTKLQSPLTFRRNMKETYRLDFQLVLKSLETSFEGQTLKQSSGNRGWKMGSVQLPTEMATTVPEEYKQTVTITNAGNTEANLTFRLYGGADGNVTNPVIRNLTMDTLMKIQTTLSGASEYIEVDSKAGTVKDQDGNDLSGLLTNDSVFVTLQVGSNELVYTSDEGTGNVATHPVATREEPTENIETDHRDATI